VLGLVHQPFEPQEVELIRTDPDHVARQLGHDGFGLAERLAQLRHVVLERVRGVLRRARRPKLIDQPVGGDDLVRTREEQCQKSPLPRPAERQHTLSLDDLYRAKDPELHVSARPRR
jgi:hypothetical protein